MSDELQLTSPDGESIGQRLRHRREATGLTVSAAAAKLRCDETIITALEADRFEELGAPVFARGHLRRYAELLAAPVDELLADWAKRGVQTATPDLTRIPRAPARNLDREAWGRRLGALAGAVVIGVAAWWILQGGAVQTPVAVPAPTVVAPVASSTPAESSTPAATSTSAEVATLTEPPVSATASTVTDPAAAPASAPTASVPLAAPALAAPVATPVASSISAAPLTISIEVRVDCWTEIYDAEGRKLYFDTLRTGKKASVSGVAPLRVLLGRADRASLTVGGRPVDIPAALVRDTVAYFSIDGAAQLRDLPRSVTTP